MSSLPGAHLTYPNRRPKAVALWWMAIRPRTLSLAAVPVLAGSALAWAEGAAVAWSPFVVALLCAVLIQAGTNLFNDVGDALRGNDGATRVGPLRVTAAGLATPAQVRRAACVTFIGALIGGVYLIFIGGWPILAIGLASLCTGWAYSGGPRPLSHSAWGEMLVMVFFGLVAVSGSHYLQSGALTASALLCGLALGAHAAAVLLVNNVRDLDTDRRAGRRTLAAVVGPAAARRLYGIFMIAPFALLAAEFGTRALGPAWLALPVCLTLAFRFRAQALGSGMNVLLARTAQAQLLLGTLLCAAWLM